MTVATKHYVALTIGVSMIGLIAGPAAAQPVSGSDAAEVSPSDQVTNEIIVTASKRDQKQRDVPSVVAIVSSERIANEGIQDFRDYAKLVPGLSQRDYGIPGIGTIVLRGLNTGSQQQTNTAAYYIDEAQATTSGFSAVGSLITPAVDLGDVERIEVLKGPQSTLYGANTLGGLIRVLSKKPDSSKFFGDSRIEGTAIDGADVGFSVRGAVNVPIIADKLAIRASGFYRDAPGYVNNSRTGDKNFNTSESFGGRVALRYTPTEDLTIDLSGLIQNTNSIGQAVQANIAGTLTPRDAPYTYSAYGRLPTNLRYRIGSATVSYDLGPLTWTTTGSYGDYNASFEIDYTDSFLGLLGFARYPTGTAITSVQAPVTTKYTAESRLISDRLGSFEFVVGGYYTNEKTKFSQLYSAINPSTGALVSGPFSVIRNSLGVSAYEEYAAFGNATFYILDNLDVTGGLRYSHNTENSTINLPLNGRTASSLFVPSSPTQFKATGEPLTYLATLRWRPTEKVSAYFRYATGFRPGGPQANVALIPVVGDTVKPDTTENYEVGIKGSALNGQFTFDISAYHIDWRNIQLNSIVNARSVTVNGGLGTVDGFEVAFNVAPTRGLNIGSTVGYTNARLKSADAGVQTATGARPGDRLPLTPDFTVTVFADQTFAIATDVEGSVGGTYSFQSGMPSSFPNDRLNTNIRLPSFGTLDLRAGAKFRNYGLQFRVDNVADTVGYTSAVTNRLVANQPGVTSQLTVIRPRTYTLSLSAAF